MTFSLGDEEISPLVVGIRQATSLTAPGEGQSSTRRLRVGCSLSCPCLSSAQSGLWDRVGALLSEMSVEENSQKPLSAYADIFSRERIRTAPFGRS